MLMSQQATDIEKRELFKRLADELAFEALELELIVKKMSELIRATSTRSWSLSRPLSERVADAEEVKPARSA